MPLALVPNEPARGVMSMDKGVSSSRSSMDGLEMSSDRLGVAELDLGVVDEPSFRSFGL